MSITFADDDVSTARHRRDDMTRLDRQDLVTVAVEQQEWFAAQSGSDFTSSRLRCERDHARNFVHHHTHSYGHRTSEGMTHHHHPLSAGISRHLHRGRNVETAGVEIVRTAIRHPNHRDSPCRPSFAELVIEPVSWPEQTAQCASARHDRPWLSRLTSRYLMPQQRHQTAHGEHLDMTQGSRHHHTLRRQHVQGVKRSLHRLYPTKAMATPRPTPIDFDDPHQRDVALRVGRAWRDIRRGASMSALVDYFFGTGDDALESGQMDTLDILVQHEGWRMGDLADALRVDPSTATRAVQRLERVGLASRCTSPSDKRVVVVSVTEAGRERHAAAQARRLDALRAIMEEFDTKERQHLAAFLERFVHALDGFVAQVDRAGERPSP